jgi:diguanylate cyclase (GGDEF)-like protein
MALSCKMLLHEAVEQVDLSAYPYFLVLDENGMLVGVVSPEEIASRVGSWNATERTRWADMPLESLVKTRIEKGHYPDSEGAEPWSGGIGVNCTVLGEGGRPLAIMTPDDLLISWRATESTLRAALVDAVTQLPNRLVFHQRLDEEIIRSHRLGSSVGVILIDVDHFKQTNDVHGHAAGDLVLQAVGRALQCTMRSYDHVARFGGDEFAVVCSGCRPNEINLPLRRLQKAIRELRQTALPAFAKLSVSMGAAVAHDSQTLDQPETLIDAADQCLYRAKGSGRDCAFKREATAGPIEASAIRALNDHSGRDLPEHVEAAAGPL